MSAITHPPAQSSFIPTSCFQLPMSLSSSSHRTPSSSPPLFLTLFLIHFIRAPKFRLNDGVKGTRDLMVSFDGLEEVDSTGVVQKPGRKIASLASKDFTITFPDEFSVQAKLVIDAKTFPGAGNIKCTDGATQAITAESSVVVSGIYNPAEKVL